MKRTLLKIAAWVAGIWLAIMIIVQIVLSSSILTGLINKYADQFIDGDITFGKAQVSVFRRFPKVSMTLEDFSITYPSERYDSLERAGVQGHMLYSGCADTADTLASFKEFSASIRLIPLIKGEIHIPHVNLVKPRIFAHSYDSENANWDIFKIDNDEAGRSSRRDESSCRNKSCFQALFWPWRLCGKTQCSQWHCLHPEPRAWRLQAECLPWYCDNGRNRSRWTGRYRAKLPLLP